MPRSLEQILATKGPIRCIGVVGMGYVGIPSAMLFASRSTFSFVWGFQRDSPTGQQKIALLNQGISPLKGEEPGLEALIREMVKARKFRCTADFSHVTEVDAVTIATQTPFRNASDLVPDFSPLEEGLHQVGRYLRPGTLVVIESTVTPGTTDGLARKILEEESGLTAGQDFALAHAPERVMAGRLIRNLQEHDRIVGGIDPTSTSRAIELYQPLLKTGRILPMTSTAAEVTKTAENTFRDLQIAAVNELALYCEAMGVNIYEVREGIASLKEEGVTRAILWPGAGVGGHCLPKDTYHLERGVKMANLPVDYPNGMESLFTLARSINDFMPTHMWHLTVEGLRRLGKTPEGTRIAILGWAYIADSDDTRNTPAEPYYRLAYNAGAKVIVHDPWVEECSGIPLYHALRDVLADTEAIAIFTRHTHYLQLDPDTIKAFSQHTHPVIIDGRNCIDPTLFINAGFIYKGIGRGDKNNHQIVNV